MVKDISNGIITHSMRQIFIIFFLGIASISNGQTSLNDQNFIAIDHIPIVVKDINALKKTLSDILYFRIKEGKEHEGIKNFFLKFQDGTYLEIISPTDSLQVIGKYYTDFLKNRQGGTSLAISVSNAAIITRNLKSKSLSFEVDSNKIWKTVSPQGINLFFIDYTNKDWKDSKINTTHPNNALLLKSTYIISDNIKAAIYKYKSFGFRQITNGNYLGIPCKKIVVGKNSLYFLDSAKSSKLTTKFGIQNLTGICGFEIKVSSLVTINKLLQQTDNVVMANSKTTYYLKDINLFIDFSE
jgi:Glyoxalase-like domain